MEGQLKNKLDFNAEFLGVTSLAVFSAPWFLQVILLLIIGILFYSKMFADSRNLANDIEMIYSKMQNIDKNQLFDIYRKKFLGFNVHSSKVPAYWSAFTLYVITLLFALINTLYELTGFIF